MKRFWAKAEAVERDGHFAILLDGRPMRLPGGPALSLASPALAEAIAGEWQEAGTGPGTLVREEDIPLTRLAGTVQERVAPDPPAAIAALSTYAVTDLLCYRAEPETPLAAHQHERWQPWLDWAAAELGARLETVSGIMPLVQPDRSVEALRRALLPLTPPDLGALAIIVPATGSLVLSLALARGALDAQDAVALAALEETVQAEQWGEDDEAAERSTRVARDILDAARFMALSRQ